MALWAEAGRPKKSTQQPFCARVLIGQKGHGPAAAQHGQDLVVAPFGRNDVLAGCAAKTT